MSMTANLNTATAHPPTSPPQLSVADALRSYGLRHAPFQLAEKCTSIYPSEGSDEIYHQLDTTATLRSVMTLTGAPGLGKTTLVKSWLRRLDAKAYRPLLVTQSSLSATGVLETMLSKLGQAPRLKRSSNLTQLAKSLDDLQPATVVLVLDDAQNFSGVALEEIRLLLGLGDTYRSSLAMILLGDEYLVGSLRLSAQRALYSRIGSGADLKPLRPEETGPYLQWHLRQAGLDRELYTPTAQELLWRASEGNPRILNHLAQSAFFLAARATAPEVEASHVHQATRQIPHTAGKQGEP